MLAAAAHRILQILSHRDQAAQQAGTIGKLPSMRRRRAWARSIHRLLERSAAVSPSWWRSPHPYWDFPPLTRREVIWACRPALLAIAGALGDQRQPISATALRQLKTFLCYPSVSPLFGNDPGAARRAAQQLQRSFTGHPEPGSHRHG
jgi:hypothetical protein